MGQVTLLRGDITTQRVDVIVNAANSSLLGGGGVDGAIHRAGGPSILAACRTIRETEYPDGLPPGGAVAATAGDLPARWVIHTVGPVYSASEDRSAILTACHIASLDLATRLGARTIAFPAISTGAYGYPVEQAAPLAVRAAMARRDAFDDIRFVLFDQITLGVFERALLDEG